MFLLGREFNTKELNSMRNPEVYLHTSTEITQFKTQKNKKGDQR